MESEQEAQLLESYISGQVPVKRLRSGCIAGLFKLIAVGIFGVILFYGVVAITDPWAFHIGGRTTPFLTWHGYGKLLTKGGAEYPLYISFFPSPHFSQLHREGLRPTGGVQGSAWLCTAPGVTQYVTLGGTIYGGWRTTEGSFMAFRLVEQRIINVGQGQGFFDLEGRWRGPELVMDERGDHGELGETFRSGLRIDHASVTFDWGTYSDFKSLCAKMPKVAARR